MAQATIGKAYIQIVPIAPDFKSKLQAEIDKDSVAVAESSGKKFGSSFGTYFGAGLKVAGALVLSSMTAIVTASAKIAQAVVGAYGEYEQLVGGVETLFGAGGKSLEEYASSVGLTVDEARGKYNELMMAQDAVVKNANDAWQTVGIDANSYMQTVTSFSASLLQSLGGDTTKAVEYSNRALIDMADNANKMGTDIGMIQNAYQGFAKQNYMMLDNLKLGYGGTKTEMERLIADASKMTDVQQKLGIVVEEGNMSFGNIINAISVMQEKMGIAGTTSKEATETIQGSLNALKATWSNLIIGLGNSEADIKQLVNNIVVSFKNLVKNVTPVIQAIADALPIVFQAIGEMLPELFNTLVPSMLQAFIALVEAIITNLPTIFPTIIQAILTLVDMIVQNIGTIVSMLIELVIAIIVAVAENIDTIIPELVKGIILAIVALIEHLPEIIVAVLKLVWGIFDGIIDTIVEGVAWIFENIVKPIGEFLADLFTTIWEWLVDVAKAVWDWMVDVATSIYEWFAGIFKAIGDFFSNIWKTVSEWFSNLWKNIKEWFTNVGLTIATFFAEKIQALVTWVTNVWNTVSDWFKSLPSKIWEKLKSMWTSVTSWASEKIQSVRNWAKGIVEGIWNGIGDKLQWIKDKIAGFVDNVLGWFKKLFGINSPSVIFAEYGEFIDLGFAKGIDDSIPAVLNSVDGLGDAVDDRMGDVLDDIQSTTLGFNSALPSQMALATDVSETVGGSALLASTLDINNQETQRLEDIRALLTVYFPTLIDTLDHLKVVLDSGQTVGGLISEIDRQLGVLNNLKERGAYV